jgi:hypothetical protein
MASAKSTDQCEVGPDRHKFAHVVCLLSPWHFLNFFPLPQKQRAFLGVYSIANASISDDAAR